MTAAQAPPQQESTRPRESISAPRATVTARLRSSGSRLGPLPVINLVVLEIGLAVGLALVTFDTGLWGGRH
jgi:hypothetical protein